ncbi:MAG: DHH family phosphoesterase [Verrucomicrobiales bacterium]|jgi:phosphoesterase RecJ-like protein|nr:DHH family phosphoesterase [Verrucomicrobiales bacterium]
MKLKKLLKQCLSSGCSGTIRFVHEGRRGSMHLRDGQLLHAELGGAEGEVALFQMLEVPEATVVYDTVSEVAPATVYRTVEELLGVTVKKASPPRGLFVPPHYGELVTALAQAESVILLSHIRPDGDAYGSTLGLGLSLLALGKRVRIFNRDGLNSLYRFLPRAELIERTPARLPEADLLVALDTSTEERLGLGDSLRPAVSVSVDWNIDHHASNTGYGRRQFVDPSQPAVAGVVTDLIAEARWPLTAEVATALYVGLLTDTGSFRYRGTSPHTFDQAALLVAKGADPAELAKQCYQNISVARFKLQQRALANLQFEFGGALTHTTLTPADFTESGALVEDTEGIVETGLAISGTELAALFELKDDGGLKVSLRSKGRVNVSELALEFDGGGHPGAAGIGFKTDGAAARERVLARLRKEFV